MPLEANLRATCQQHYHRPLHSYDPLLPSSPQACPGLYEQLVAALRAHNIVTLEVARLQPGAAGAGTGGGRLTAGQRDRLQASALLILTLLERARERRMWQLLLEAAADAAAAILAAQPAPPSAAAPSEVRRALHTAETPAARAAAGFIGGMIAFEHEAKRRHPLLTDAIRGAPPPYMTEVEMD